MNTEIFSQVNWLALFIATVAYFLLGALWYSKALFGQRWATLVKLDMNNPDLKKGMGKKMAASFLLMLLACLGLSLLIIKFDMISILAGIKLGVLTGTCFAATALSISFIYESKHAGLFLIDCGYHFSGQVLASVILVMWR